VLEKSDCAVVPVNQPNKEGQPSAEASPTTCRFIPALSGQPVIRPQYRFPPNVADVKGLHYSLRANCHYLASN
jgi:hypothetical protein